VGPLNRVYDVFERLPDGTDLWKGYVQGLEQAQSKLQELAEQSKNEFYAIHSPTKEIAARVNVRQP
jgi:sugar-specific transcriptional regulator TrmB